MAKPFSTNFCNPFNEWVIFLLVNILTEPEFSKTKMDSLDKAINEISLASRELSKTRINLEKQYVQLAQDWLQNYPFDSIEWELFFSQSDQTIGLQISLDNTQVENLASVMHLVDRKIYKHYFDVEYKGVAMSVHKSSYCIFINLNNNLSPKEKLEIFRKLGFKFNKHEGFDSNLAIVRDSALKIYNRAVELEQFILKQPT